MTVLATVVLVLALVFEILPVADAADRCYDCDATTDRERCMDPVKNNIRTVPCNERSVPSNVVHVVRQFGTEMKEYDCYTLDFQGSDPLQPGVYRGCTYRPTDAKSSCDLLREALDYGNGTKCESCKDNECNRDKPRLNDSDSAHGQLRCFDCSPRDVGRCVEPQKENANGTVCGSDAASESGLQKEIADEDRLDLDPRLKTRSKFQCFAIYFESDNLDKPSGVYRGCKEASEKYLNICEDLKDEFKDKGNLTRCEFCEEEMCNIQFVGGAAVGGTAVGGTAVILLSPLIALVALFLTMASGLFYV